MRPITRPSRQLTHPRPLPLLPVVKRTWVGKWVRSESFWQDVTSRALSGLLVGLAGVLVATGGGFIQPGIALKIALSVVVVIAIIVTANLIINTIASEMVNTMVWLRRVLGRRLPPDKARRRAFVVGILLAVLFTIAIVFTGLLIALVLLGLIWLGVPS